MAKKKAEKPKATMRGVLDAATKEAMIVVICRNRDVFEQVYPLLDVSDVRLIGDPAAIAYKAVLAHYQEYHEMPEKAQVLAGVQQVFADHPGRFSEIEVEATEEFVDLAFDAKAWGKKDISKDSTYAKYALKNFRRFKDELAAAELSEAMYTGKRVAIDLAGSLKTAQDALSRNASIEARPVPKIFGKGWRKRTRPLLRSCGITVFDGFMGGGWRNTEVLLFMGPYGSCKTTVAVQAMCDSAKAAKAATLERTDGKIEKVVLASYEMPLAELQERCLAYLAQIPRYRLAEMSDLSKQLRKGGDLLKYEEHLFAEQIKEGGYILSESQRVDVAEDLLNEYAVFLDMTNTDPDNPQGTGGPLELQGILKSEQRRAKDQVVYHSVIVDHAAAMVCNMMGVEEYSITDDSTRKLLKYIPKQLGDWIGKQFNVPVMLLHQLSGEANSRNPTATFHHTDSDECKSIGMFADFCVVTGPPTKDERQLCVFDCTKHRRQPPKARSIVQVEGQYNKVSDVSSKYSIDQGARVIVLSSEADTFVETGEAPKISKKGGKKSAAAKAGLATSFTS